MMIKEQIFTPGEFVFSEVVSSYYGLRFDNKESDHRTLATILDDLLNGRAICGYHFTDPSFVKHVTDIYFRRDLFYVEVNPLNYLNLRTLPRCNHFVASQDDRIQCSTNWYFSGMFPPCYFCTEHTEFCTNYNRSMSLPDNVIFSFKDIQSTVYVDVLNEIVHTYNIVKPDGFVSLMVAMLSCYVGAIAYTCRSIVELRKLKEKECKVTVWFDKLFDRLFFLCQISTIRGYNEMINKLGYPEVILIN